MSSNGAASHLRAETGVLPLRAHLELCCQQFYANRTASYLIVTSPPPPRDPSLSRSHITALSVACELKVTTPPSSSRACWKRALVVAHLFSCPTDPKVWSPRICERHPSRSLNSWQGFHSSAICPHCRSILNPLLSFIAFISAVSHLLFDLQRDHIILISPFTPLHFIRGPGLISPLR